MSDDRELVERLAAIDVTPRASWVAELRADLDAAWETGDASYLDSLRTTTLTLVDHEPTPAQPSTGRRWAILIGAAAAVLVAAALVAIRGDDVTPADQPSPTVTAPTTVPVPATVTVPATVPTTVTVPATVTVPPRALFRAFDELYAPGTYFVDEVGGSPTPRIFVTLGEGWRHARSKGAIRNAAIGVMTFSRPARVFSDACHPDDGFHPESVTTIDGLVAALSEQGGWLNVTAPTDITIDGYRGRTFQRTAPADFAGCTHTGDTPFRSFDDGGRPGGWPYYERGEIETLRVLDVNGTIILITTRSKLGSNQEAAAVAALAAVLDSIRIEQT